MQLSYDFYNRPSLEVAPWLVGKILVRNCNGIRLSARIVEVEAYMGPEDKAAHSYNNRRTKKNEVMYGPPGYAYVYMIYGMYYCVNVITSPVGIPHGILIRAAEPIEGIEQMSNNRYSRPLSSLSKAQYKGLTNGPGKLCSSMNINLSINGTSLKGPEIIIEDSPLSETYEISSSPRINIAYSEEAALYPWRFFIANNPFVSKP